MKISIRNVVDEKEWSELLSQSPYSWHGHSMEYQKIIQMNDQRHENWIDILIEYNSEKYLLSGEIFNHTFFAQEKYYSGLIPISTRFYTGTIIQYLSTIFNQSHINKIILSYLETDPMYNVVKFIHNIKIMQNNNWLNASIMRVDKSYDVVWNKVYDTKARNMVRKSRKWLEFKMINILDYIDDAIDCTLSKPIRHRSLMPEYYRVPELFRKRWTKLAEILGDQAISFGSFYEGKLVAYINTIRGYHEAIISNLLSNSNYWKYAPNNGLFDFMIQYYCKDEGINQLMYSFDGVEGVDHFKHSVGFLSVPVMRCVWEV